MSRKAQRARIGVLVGLGGTLLAVVQVRNEIDQLASLPAWSYTAATLVGLALLVLAAVIWLMGRVALPHTDYVAVRARPTDLSAVRDFAIQNVDAEVLSLQTLHAMVSRNPEIIHLVIRRLAWGGWRRKDVVGLFAVIPVNAEARSRLLANQLRGFRIEPTHVAKKGRRAAALYIAILGANGALRAEGASLLALSTYLTGKVDRTPTVFTRPVTKDGLRLVRKYRFQPVSFETPERETVFVRDFRQDPI